MHVQAVGIIGMVAYFSYLMGDYLGLSGIVSLFCCAVTMSHYALHNITKQQRAATVSAFETLSFLSEGAIFVYVGLDTLDPLKWKVRPHLCCSAAHIPQVDVRPTTSKILLLCAAASRYTIEFVPLCSHTALTTTTWQQCVFSKKYI